MVSPVSRVEVLIVGAGPAGLFLATQLSKLKLDCRVIDKAAHKVLRGHADGLQCRTGEVLHALGVGADFDKESNECAEVVTYEQDDNGEIHETMRVPDTAPGTSWARHVLLGQDRVEAIFIDAMKANNNLEVERLVTPTNIEVDEGSLDDPGAYPVRVTLRRVPAPSEHANGDVKSGLYRSNLFVREDTPLPDGSNGEEVVHCKFLVGCDGARSFVRRSLGIEMHGDAANVYWGCFDALVKTDLPTIRLKNHINLREGEGVRMIPREKGLLRIYTQMGVCEPGTRVKRSDVTLEKMLAKVKAALHPFQIDFPQVDWFSCYEVGQRLTDRFSAHQHRIFIAGDACHTHSPRAGQGMNISMMDTWNLGWKLAMVCRGQARKDILATYDVERRAVAKDLINMHSRWSRITAAMLENPDRFQAAELAEEFRKAGQKAAKFVSGTGIVYHQSIIVRAPSPTEAALASKITTGSHFPNAQVVCVANAHAVQLQKRLTGDGRWRILLFAGDIRSDRAYAAFTKAAQELDAEGGFIRRFTPPATALDSVVECLTICASPRREVEKRCLGWPSVLQPERGPHKVPAFDTVFCDDETFHDGHGHAYEKYGINPSVGCIVVTRPDQHVASIFNLEDVAGIGAYFESFLLCPTLAAV